MRTTRRLRCRMPKRRKLIADQMRVLFRRFLRKLRHGDFDTMLPVFEAQIHAVKLQDRLHLDEQVKAAIVDCSRRKP